MDTLTEREVNSPRTRVGVTRRVMEFARANAFPIALFVALRVWTLVWASMVAAYVQPSASAAEQYYGVEPLRDAIIAPWQRWDTIWYSKIATEGYADDVRVVFAPLYPLLMRAVSLVTAGNVVAAGLVISSIAALASFILLYHLARELADERAARRALLFLAAFPTAFYLFAAYTEAVFLAFILGAFLCMRRRQWWATGILGALAAMTRTQGVLVLLPFAVAFWFQWRHNEIRLRQSLALGLIVLGGSAHWLWLMLQFGSLEVWMQAQLVWHRAVLPWQALFESWQTMVNAPSALEGALTFFQLSAEVLMLGVMVWSARRLPLAYTAYTAIVALPPLLVVTTYSSQFPLTGVLRFAILVFPLFLLLGKIPKQWWQTPLLALLFVMQTFWLMLFVAWVFVH